VLYKLPALYSITSNEKRQEGHVTVQWEGYVTKRCGSGDHVKPVTISLPARCQLVARIK